MTNPCHVGIFNEHEISKQFQGYNVTVYKRDYDDLWDIIQHVCVHNLTK